MLRPPLLDGHPAWHTWRVALQSEGDAPSPRALRLPSAVGCIADSADAPLLGAASGNADGAAASLAWRKRAAANAAQAAEA